MSSRTGKQAVKTTGPSPGSLLYSASAEEATTLGEGCEVAMNAWRRGTSRGLGYSLAVTALGTWMGAATVMGMRLPVPPLTVLAGALLSLVQGALLGLAAAPLLRLQRYGTAAHAAVVLLGWLVFSWTFAMNRSDVPNWLVGPLAGLFLFL